jgi:endonuclease/exonuclease/phosphatase (EEP) superfamily protein YafD
MSILRLILLGFHIVAAILITILLWQYADQGLAISPEIALLVGVVLLFGAVNVWSAETSRD